MTSGLGVSAEMVWIFFVFFFSSFPYLLPGLRNPGRKKEGPSVELRDMLFILSLWLSLGGLKFGRRGGRGGRGRPPKPFLN